MKNNDPFCITGWGREGITDPMEAIAEIFSYMDMGSWRRLITKMADHALSGKVYRRRAPGDVLVAMKVVRSALIAAHALQDATGADVAVTKYGTGMGSFNHWDDFPCAVSFKEYCRPCSVFKKLFKKRPLSQWINDWEQLVAAALSSCNLDGERWVLRTRTGLLKLLEAAHLVWMRDGGGGSVKQSTTHESGEQHKTAPTS